MLDEARESCAAGPRLSVSRSAWAQSTTTGRPRIISPPLPPPALAACLARFGVRAMAWAEGGWCMAGEDLGWQRFGVGLGTVACAAVAVPKSVRGHVGVLPLSGLGGEGHV